MSPGPDHERSSAHATWMQQCSTKGETWRASPGPPTGAQRLSPAPLIEIRVVSQLRNFCAGSISTTRRLEQIRRQQIPAPAPCQRPESRTASGRRRTRAHLRSKMPFSSARGPSPGSGDAVAQLLHAHQEGGHRGRGDRHHFSGGAETSRQMTRIGTKLGPDAFAF
jgi:hypothetical protein